jgi:MFS family permease
VKSGTPAAVTPVRVAYWVLAVLFAMNLLNYIDRFILAAVLKQVKEDKDFLLTNTQAGSLTSAFFISYTIFSPLVGLLGDRVRRKYLIAAGVGVWSLATFASGFTAGYGHMMIARSILGIGEASYATLAPALIGDLFRRDKRNFALTIFYMAIPLGAALGYILGGKFGVLFGWRAAFMIVGLPGLILAFAVVFIREPRRGATEEVEETDLDRHDALPLTWKVYATLARNRSYVYNALGMAAFTFAMGGLVAWAPDYLVTVEHVGHGLSEAELEGPTPDERETKIDEARTERATWRLGIVVLASGLVGTILGGRLADKLVTRFRGVYFWLSGVSILAGVPFILAGLTLRDEFALFAALLVGLTLASMNYGPTNTIIINVTDPKIRAAAFAVNIFLIHLLGDIPSPTLIGRVRDLSGSPFLGMAVTLPVLGLGGILFCLGAPHLEADQEAVTKGLRGG